MLISFLAALLITVSPTTAYVRDLAPHLEPARAHHLAQTIDAAARRYEVRPELLAAIIKVESNFEPDLRQCGIATWRRHGITHRRPTCDYGIAQINDTWVKKWGLDADLLQHSDTYNIYVAARILRWLKRNFHDQEPRRWFGRYHSSTPSEKALYLERLRPLLATR